MKDKIELSKRELSLVEDKPRLDFRKKEEKYILRMPFDGKLQYQFSIPPDNSVALYMDAASPIATVCDDSSYYLTISISDPDLTNLPPESLSLSVPLGDGSALKGVLPSNGWRRMFPAAGNCWRIFPFAPSGACTSPFDAGFQLHGPSLLHAAGRSVSSQQGEAGFPAGGKKCSSWQELLEKVHPDLELVVNGETELIVRKNEIAVRISLFQLFRQAVDFENYNRVFTSGITILKGYSGCGKTTLLKILAGYLSPQRGRVITPAVRFRRIPSTGARR